MNRSASSKSAQSVPRADSPMQEDVGLAHAASARDTRSTDFSASRPDAPPSGFTAVNGDRRIALFRPDTSAPILSRSQKGEQAKSSMSDAPRPSPLNHPSTWPRAEHADADRGAHVNKRKRADSAGHHAGEDGPSLAAAAAAAASSSSKKRPSNTINNSRTNARSPESTVVTADRRAPESAVTITYARERSPDSTRWNNGEPPPPPRPEIAAGLAESIQRSLSSLKQQGRKPSTASEHEHCNPPVDLHAPEPDSASPSGEAPESPSGENKPRKRNFSNRTKTGCHTCRFRKKKCDEGKPVCGNCLRGQFVCKGYGPRPPGSSSKAVRQVQHAGPGQQPYEHASNQAPPTSQSQPPPPPRRESTPSRYYPPVEPVHPPQPYAPWERMIPPTTSNDKFRHPPRYSEPAPADHRPSSSRDAWPPHDAPPAFAQDHRPPPDYHQVPPLASYGPHRPPLPDPWGAPTPVPTYRPPTAAGTVISGRDSVTTSSSNVSQLPLSYGPTGQLSERSKMITGKPYRHFLDDELIRDRQSCKRAVESYNDAARASSTLSPAEKERLFKAVIDPSSRAYDGDAAMHWRGPKGTCGARTIVECPFTCDYGYNIHFGDDAVISPNCQMQDACDIYIGNRTVVGPNVMFYCMTTSIDPGIRKGSQGNFTAGAIKVEDDVYIGAGVIIMPFRTIGKGAVIGAGSVVTKDVKPYTVVAGNPAKFIRRINRGQRDESHQNPDIQEQNERMLERMQSGLSYGYRDRFL